ncbi:hypothetical protein GOODEAATRI_024589, partial [Goodea atripinnis]
GMACVGRTKECTIVPSNHYGPIPGIPVGTTWKFRVQVSEAGVHRPHVGGIHGRSNDGSYSLVLAGGFEDEVVGFTLAAGQFSHTGSTGMALALNCDAPLNDKDGAESRNWRAGKPVRVVRSSKGRRISKYAPEEGNRYDGSLNRLFLQYPPGYLAAMANKTKKEACARPGRGGRSKHYPGRGRPRRRKIKTKEEEEAKEEEELVEEEEGGEPPEAQMQEDAPQSNGEQKTTGETVSHNYPGILCPQTCLQRSFRAAVYTCPACRHDLGKDYAMNQNKKLQILLDQFFPGYSKGR